MRWASWRRNSGSSSGPLGGTQPGCPARIERPAGWRDGATSAGPSVDQGVNQTTLGLLRSMMIRCVAAGGHWLAPPVPPGRRAGAGARDQRHRDDRDPGALAPARELLGGRQGGVGEAVEPAASQEQDKKDA